MSKKIAKALTPEEMTMVSNIQSIIQELMQSGGQDVQMAEEEELLRDEEMTEKEDVKTQEEDTEGKEVKMILKALENTESDGATASDDTEERLDEALPEQDEENLSEVEKAVRVLLRASQKKIKKSKNSSIIHVLNKIVEVQKASQSKVDELSTAFANVLEGLGVSKQLEVAQMNQGPAKKINKSQNEELINALSQIVGKVEKAEDKYISQGNVVRKNLSNADVLSGLLKR